MGVSDHERSSVRCGRPSRPPDVPGASTRRALDDAVATLRSNAGAWHAASPAVLLGHLDDARRRFRGVMASWVDACLQAKGYAPRSSAEAEEWMCAAVVVRALRLLRRSVRDLERFGRPRLAGPVTPARDGRAVVRVFPHDLLERLVYRGMTGEAWLATEADRGAPFLGRALGAGAAPASPEVCLVLGAGNASMLPVVDALHQLFVQRRAVVLKLNPLNAYLGPAIEDAFGSLVAAGVLRVVCGGAEVGAYLTRHDRVDAVHLTGSAKTFETIVFGGGADGVRRKRSRRPLLEKPFTAELGNVSPVIVVPGPWTDRDVLDMAEQVATWLVGNAGFACLAPRVLVQHAAWPQRQAFVEALTAVLERVPTRPAWYPGAFRTHERFVAAHRSAWTSGTPPPGHLPWTLIDDVDAGDADDICFTTEPFCALVSETALDADDPVAFVAEAVRFANGTLWGSLCATLVVHPAVARDPALADAVERAVADLRYGTVTVNVPTFAAYYLLTTPWGAHPGHAPWDVQSGIGRSTNLQMLGGVEKSVVRGPFRKAFDPIRVTAPRAHEVARSLAYAEADWSTRALARLAWSMA